MVFGWVFRLVWNFTPIPIGSMPQLKLFWILGSVYIFAMPVKLKVWVIDLIISCIILLLITWRWLWTKRFLLQLQQERRKLIAELEEVRRERDGQQSQTEQLRRELNSLRAQLEETEWSLCQKSGEIRMKYVTCSVCAEYNFNLLGTSTQQNN